jgi:hypothetical protein
MQKFLEKISWKFRRIEIAFSPLYVNWSGGSSYFIFSIFRIQYNLRSYSLFEIALMLPNKTTTKYFYVYSWDILFLSNYLHKLHANLLDRDLWNKRGLSTWDRFKLNILDKILCKFHTP